MPNKRNIFLSLCVLAFMAAVWGSIYCGLELQEAGIDDARQDYLWRLIYFHFALSQVAAIGAVFLFYWGHQRWRRYYLIVSYKESGMGYNPPGIRIPEGRVYRVCLGQMAQAELPPCDAPILVYPLFMQSGYSSGERLEKELHSAYRERGLSPQLYMQPVIGASPWLAEAAAEKMKPSMQKNSGILVIAHGTAPGQASPPEPALFCRRLQKLLPHAEISLFCFAPEKRAQEALAAMQSKHVLVLPFLLSEGLHTKRDLPTQQDAHSCGKEIKTFSPLGSLLQGD